MNLTFLVGGGNPSVTIQMKATEQYFHVVLFIYYAVQGGSKSVDDSLFCDHSTERY